MSVTKRNTIRQLRAGDPIPPGQPRRYRSQHGYIRLRWKVGERSYVEVYEHRFVAGLPPGHVHHRNEVKSDNRPSNLEALSPSSHTALHNPFTWDVDEGAKLYQSGWTLLRLEARYGVNHVTIRNGLLSRGVVMRSPARPSCVGHEAATTVRGLHLAGYSAPAIASRLGVTVQPVRDAIRRMGLPRHRAGRRPGFEREAA